MGMPSRLLRLSWLLPAALLLGAAAAASAQEDHAHMKTPAPAPAAAMHQSRWSDPRSWPDGKVPGEGEAVTIPRGRDIVLDVSPPWLRSLTVNGRLSFSDARDLALETDWIYLAGGELDIGSEARPYTRHATITLTDKVPGEDINTMGDRGIMLLAGTLNLHGDRTNAWTKLADTAKAGSTRIQVLDARGWRKGDVIVLASTDYNPRQAEERTITAIDGNALTLDKPLAYMQTETGNVNSYMHIWVYQDAADRATRRQALQSDPEWASYLTKSAEAGYVVSQENRLMTPVPFFKP